MHWISSPSIQSQQSRPFYPIGMYRVWCNWHYLNDRIITDNEEIEIRHASKAWSPRCLLSPSLVLHTCVITSNSNDIMVQLHATAATSGTTKTVGYFCRHFILRFEFGQGQEKNPKLQPIIDFYPSIFWSITNWFLKSFWYDLQSDFYSNMDVIWFPIYKNLLSIQTTCTKAPSFLVDVFICCV